MQTLSLAAHDVRVRNAFVTLTGAVVFASAITQALANPIFVERPSFEGAASQALQAPAPTLAPPPVAAPIAAAAFAFRAPTPGYPINSPFGLRRLPWEPRGRMHEGVDIAAPKGLPVGATLAGTVLRAGLSSTYGRFVEVRHAEGLTSLYAHLGSVRRGLKPGARLAAGEAVGLVGNTGRSTGEHLHFEIRNDERPLNPALFIGKSFASADDLPLDAAARFSRRVRLAVVSPATLARMMPTAAKAPAETINVGKGGRARAVLAPAQAPTVLGDPSPQASAAALAARAARQEAAASEPSAVAPPPPPSSNG